MIPPFLESLHFNVDLMREKAEAGYLNATKIVESLIMKGMPFRDAHHLVGTCVQKAVEKKCSLSEISKEFQIGSLKNQKVKANLENANNTDSNSK